MDRGTIRNLRIFLLWEQKSFFLFFSTTELSSLLYSSLLLDPLLTVELPRTADSSSSFLSVLLYSFLLVKKHCC
jgi:hypothetical protein